MRTPWFNIPLRRPAPTTCAQHGSSSSVSAPAPAALHLQRSSSTWPAALPSLLNVPLLLVHKVQSDLWQHQDDEHQQPGVFLHGRRRSQGKSKRRKKMAILIRSDVAMSAASIARFSASIAIRLFQRVCTSQAACAQWNSTGQKKSIFPIAGDSRMKYVIKYAREHDIAIAGVCVQVPIKRHKPRHNNRDDSWVNPPGRRGWVHEIQVLNPLVTDSPPGNSARADDGDPTCVSDVPLSGGNVTQTHEHVWVAVGIFGPEFLVNPLTKNLPEL